MKERPILMSAPMVLANLGLRKTQTRRMTGLKKIPDGYECLGVFFPQKTINGFVIPVLDSFDLAGDERAIAMFGNGTEEFAVPCPYGTIGDRLWVRESFVELCAVSPSTDAPIKIGRGMRLIEKPTYRRHNGKKVWNYDGLVVAYRADSYVEFCDGDGFSGEFADKKDMPRWKPSIHMPRKYSRIMFEITNIRVDRLQDISEDDAIAEGIYRLPDGHEYAGLYQHTDGVYCGKASDSYRALIDDIHGYDEWDANPLVWVLDYKIVEIKGGEK